MSNAAEAISRLDEIGHSVFQALLIPSLEMLALACVVWLLIRIYGEPAPRIRHILWLLVAVKPLLSLVIPWQGPIALPLNLFDTRVVGTDVAVPTQTMLSIWLEHPYAVVFTLWGIAVAIGTGWTAAGLIRLLLYSRKTMTIPVPWVQALFDRCRIATGIRRPVELRMSDDFASPTLVWVGRPLVVVPSWCLIQLSPQELRQVFLHELLHYARRDHISLMLVQAVRICFFFHPVAWMVGRRIAVEAERACDIAVVKASQRPRSYASSLLKVAESAINAPWRGALELARSATLAAQRIRDVLGEVDSRVYALGPRTVVPLVLCAVLSVTPLLHLPVARVWYLPPEAVYTPLSIDMAPRTPPAYSLRLSDGLLTETVLPASRTETSANRLNPERMESNASVADATPVWPARSGNVVRPGLTTLPNTSEPVSRTPFDSAALGLAPSSLRPSPQPYQELRWKPGQIEVEGVGNTLSKSGIPGMISVRAGVFVTRTHELGGVFSVIESRERFTDEETGRQLAFKANESHVRTRPIGAISATGLAAAAISEVNQPADTPQPDQVIRLGAFYRYNVTGVGENVAPFVSVGAGVEVRPGRDPVLVDGGAGVRVFMARRAALVVRLDYIKEIELTPRSHVAASLGFSTIF
ncbi:MAG: hypothetical protein FJY97_01345 [candidate division Zixibacteria bacterium]|nr:hypothetical protein [candidate division Zixibacteria bacterium]